MGSIQGLKQKSQSFDWLFLYSGSEVIEFEFEEVNISLLDFLSSFALTLLPSLIRPDRSSSESGSSKCC